MPQTYKADDFRKLVNEYVNEAVYKQLAGALKHDVVSTTPTGYQLHGPLQSGQFYGPLAVPGVRPTMFSAMTHPLTAALVLDGRLERSEYTEERLELQTGVTEDSGSNAENYCGDPPAPGQAKFCNQMFYFGEWYMRDPMQVIPKVGQLRHRADVPKSIINSPPQNNPLMPEMLYGFPPDSRSLLRYGLYLVGVSLERSLEHVLIQGNRALASANTQSGWISEFDGLDQQIGTGKADAITGTLCPALDSAVLDFSADIGATMSGCGTGRDITMALTGMVHSLRLTANKGGFSGVQWAFIGPHELFYELTYQIACNYATTRCANTFIRDDARIVRDQQLDMLNNAYILVNGVRYPYIASEGVANDGIGENQFETNLYFVPLSYAGGTPLLRLEYFPMDNEWLREFADANIEIMNNGMYLMASGMTRLCKEHYFASRMRLILETPWLAGRIDNIQYCYNAAEGTHNAIPGQSYYYDGGVTYWTGVSG